MRKTIKKAVVSAFLAVLMLNMTGVPAMDKQLYKVEASTVEAPTAPEATTAAQATTAPVATTATQTTTAPVVTQTVKPVAGVCNTATLIVRNAKSSAAKAIYTLKRGNRVTVLEPGAEWVKLSYNGRVGYTRGKYIKTAYGNAQNLYANAVNGVVTSSTLVVRNGKTSTAKALVTLKKGAKVLLLTKGSTWVTVKVGNTIGYTRGKYIKIQKGTASGEVLGSGKGSSVVAYARRFLGNPYVWGGSSLTRGTDCSGFVMSIYRHFGKSLPHSSSGLRRVGRRVSGGIRNARPGDIICYSGHVAIYMGGNRVIHASNRKTGIKITNNASYRKIVAIRRIF